MMNKTLLALLFVSGVVGADSITVTCDGPINVSGGTTPTPTPVPTPQPIPTPIPTTACIPSSVQACYNLNWSGSRLNRALPAGVTHSYRFVAGETTPNFGSIGITVSENYTYAGKKVSISDTPGEVELGYPCGNSGGRNYGYTTVTYFSVDTTGSSYCDLEKGKVYYFSVRNATNTNSGYILQMN